MSDLYLIAHKVRGEPAFDVAARMECPECQGLGQRDCDDTMCECSECDSLGYWWIIPTSGHRAYPYWNCSLDDLGVSEGNMEYYSVSASVTEMPPDLPDHYAHTSSGRPQIDINGLIGLSKTFSSKHRRH